VTDYRAPLDDIDFVLNRVCGLPRILSLPGFADVDASVVRDLLGEAARFMEESSHRSTSRATPSVCS
jgi:hypothetical protein